MKWKKPSIEATTSKFILALIDIQYDDETCQEMHILSFDGIRNRWKQKNGGIGNIKLSDIKYWISIPQLPVTKEP